MGWGAQAPAEPQKAELSTMRALPAEVQVSEEAGAPPALQAQIVQPVEPPIVLPAEVSDAGQTFLRQVNTSIDVYNDLSSKIKAGEELDVTGRQLGVMIGSIDPSAEPWVSHFAEGTLQDFSALNPHRRLSDDECATVKRFIQIFLQEEVSKQLVQLSPGDLALEYAKSKDVKPDSSPEAVQRQNLLAREIIARLKESDHTKIESVLLQVAELPRQNLLENILAEMGSSISASQRENLGHFCAAWVAKDKQLLQFDQLLGPIALKAGSARGDILQALSADKAKKAEEATVLVVAASRAAPPEFFEIVKGEEPVYKYLQEAQVVPKQRDSRLHDVQQQAGHEIFADDFFALQFRILSQMEPGDLDDPSSQTVQELEKLSKGISLFVADQIRFASEPDQKRRIAKFFIRVAAQSLEKGDIATAIAIREGLLEQSKDPEFETAFKQARS